MNDELLTICEGIWAVQGSTRMGPGFYFPVRSTIIELRGGGLLLHSPVQFSAATLESIRRLGEVRYIMAPNLFHHLFLNAAAEAFPEAQVIACPGLKEKFPYLTIHETAQDHLPADLASDLSSVFIQGTPKFNEVVLFHERSQTLLVADYFFNIHETRGVLTPLILKMVGAHRKPAQSKLWRKMTQDREAMKLSAEKVLSYHYRRVIMCHGEIVADGREFTRAGLAWLEPNAR